MHAWSLEEVRYIACQVQVTGENRKPEIVHVSFRDCKVRLSCLAIIYLSNQRAKALKPLCFFSPKRKNEEKGIFAKGFLGDG